MNMTQHIDECLDEFLDGALDAEARRAVESHLAECETCRTTLLQAERLMQLAHELPAERAPMRDLWPDIEQRIQPARTMPAWLKATAAAAVIGIVFASGMLADRQLGTSTAPMNQQADVPLENARQVLSDAQISLVSKAGYEPETEATVLRNLLLINLAIRDIETALADNPSDARLREMLTTLYARENEILNRATHMTVTKQEPARTSI